MTTTSVKEEEIVGLSRTDVELMELFQKLCSDRGDYESNWEDYAGWTLPYLFPDEDVADATEMQHDYQSLGAQAVNHLANKIVMTLFNPGRPFFRLELNESQTESLVASGVKESNIEQLTGEVEREAMKRMEKVSMRTAAISVMKHLIVLGNGLIYTPKNQKSQVYSLRDYVVRRDMSGNVVQIVTRDRRVVGTLPENAREACVCAGHKEEDKVDLYTGITRQADGKFFIKQELGDVQILVGDWGLIPEEDLPWLALTWNYVRGEDYGVGLVEEYAGDFSVYSKLSENILNLASIAADIKILVDPMGQTDVEAINEAPPGEYVYGKIEDLGYAQLEKIADIQFVQQVLDVYGRRIGAAFLLNSQVTRDAERVTAEEIRLQANELESSLGGVYSRMAEDMQQPMARSLIRGINEKLVRIDPVILTGIESLSRNSEHEQMIMFMNDLSIMGNVPDFMQADLNHRGIAQILATNRGLDFNKMVLSEDDKKKRQKEMADEQARLAGKTAAAENASAPPKTI